MSDVTRVLCAIEQGDPHAAGELLTLVYDELRKLAAQKLAQEKPGQTLQATALVHEAYIRLVDEDTIRGWNSRGHFYAAAAEAMRRILIESARKKKTQKHGGARQKLDLADIEARVDPRSDAWLVVDDALTCLEREDHEAAAIAKLRLFAGLSAEQAGEALNLSRATAFRHWTYARAWLNARLADVDESAKS
jgi:RNA polymerase sigma factor (TIGR02999 family)